MWRSVDAVSRQAVTRVNVEHASKSSIWTPTLRSLKPFIGSDPLVGKYSESVDAAKRGTGSDRHLRIHKRVSRGLESMEPRLRGRQRQVSPPLMR